MSYYMHDVPGRLRIKTPVLKRNEQVAYTVRKCLGTIEGVATIDINSITGSLLVNYNPKKVRAAEIVAELTRRGLFDPARAVSNDEYVRGAVTRAGNVFTKALTGSFVEGALEGTGLSFLAILL